CATAAAGSRRPHRRIDAHRRPDRQGQFNPRQRLVRQLRQAGDDADPVRRISQDCAGAAAAGFRFRGGFAERRAHVRVLREFGRRGERGALHGPAGGRAQVRHARLCRFRLRGTRRPSARDALMEWWWVYLAIGVAVGFLAGLFGIGGGMIMVPMLVFVFTAKGFPAEHMMHLSLATSMATIVFTSLSSVRAHHTHDAVDWRVARAMAPGIVAGALAATLVAGFVPTRPLAVFFALFMLYASLQMFFEVKPKPSRQLPGAGGLFGVGAGIGALSSVLAAGGAFLSIPFLVRCNVPLKRAIGTAAANGFPIAVAGTIGYILNGLRVSGLPDGSLGFVYLPALAIVVAASMPMAPLGAKLAHRLPVKRLRIVLALMLLAIAVRMLVNLW